jgi:hypothetical protein
MAFAKRASMIKLLKSCQRKIYAIDYFRHSVQIQLINRITLLMIILIAVKRGIGDHQGISRAVIKCLKINLPINKKALAGCCKQTTKAFICVAGYRCEALTINRI